MTEADLLEQTTPEDFEDSLRRSMALALIKPDSIGLGIEDFLVDQITKKLNQRSGVNLIGGVVLENLSEVNIGKIYPDLDEKYFKGYVALLANSQAILLIFESKDRSMDLWSELKKIRGYINQGYGFEDSLRSAVPLPGQRERFEETARHIREGKLNEQDYRQMANNLVHVPANIQEFCGLFSLVPSNELEEILGKDRAQKLSKKLSEFIVPCRT